MPDRLRLAAQLLVVLKVALVVFAFDPQALDSFALTKSVMSHITALALLVVLIVLFTRDRRPFRITPLHIAIVLLVITFALATAFALDRTIATFGAWRRYLGFDQMLDNGVLFVGVAGAFRSRRERGLLAFGLLAIAVPEVAYGLLQRAGRDFVHYLENPGTLPIGSFGQPDIAGAYFGIVVACGLAVSVWPWSHIPRLIRIAAGSLTAVALFLGVATGTRGTLLAIAGGSAALAVVVLFGRFRPRITTTTAIAIAAAGALVMAVTLAIAAPLLAATFGGSGASRLEIWQTAVRAVAARPLLGLGPDNFSAAYPSLHDIRSALFSPFELQNSTHNIGLYVATSGGIAGLLAWGSVIVLTASIALYAAARREADGLILVLLGAYLGQGTVTITDVGLDWMPFVAAGLAASCWAARQPIAVPSSPKPPEMARAASVGLAAAVLALFLSQGQLTRISASEALATGEALRAAAKPLDAIQYDRRALQLDNTRAEHWGLFGSALQDAGNPSAARSAFIEAAQREPWNPLYWRDIALTYFGQGDERQTLSYLDKTIAADPYDVLAHDLVARIAFNVGNWQRALDEGALAVRIYPVRLESYEAPVRAAVHLQQWRQAEDLVKTGLAQKDGPHLRVLLALVYADSGRREEAIAQIRQALILAPGDAEATQVGQQLGLP